MVQHERLPTEHVGEGGLGRGRRCIGPSVFCTTLVALHRAGLFMLTALAPFIGPELGLDVVFTVRPAA